MFEYKEFGAFKQHARDFLVQTKQFADKDNADLFAEEHEKQGQVRSPYPRFNSVYLYRNTRVVLCQRSDLPEGEWRRLHCDNTAGCRSECGVKHITEA